MSCPREFSHITLTATPFKKRMDNEAKKSEMDVDKDANIAFKCADRFNYNTNLHRKVALSDRFELAALGYEMKGKPNSPLDDKVELSEQIDFIYRKEKKQEGLAGSPLPAGMSPQNPLPAGRGFLSPPLNNNSFNFSGFGYNSRRNTPLKSPREAIRQPPRSVFDDIPTTIV